MSDPVDVTRGDQSYCDWCLAELSNSSIRASEELGLHREFAWACDTCVRRQAFREPPQGWDGPASAWPWNSGGPSS